MLKHFLLIFEDAGNSTTVNYTNNGWGTTTNTFVSPSSSITDSPSGNYQNGANKTIAISNEIDLSTATGANLSFYAKWEIENNWDYTQVEISTNNGNTWEAQCGKFTNAGSSNGFQPVGEPVYDGVQNDWVLEEIDLSDYLGESILVRFQFASDGAQTGDGFYFDDLTVSITDETTLTAGDVLEHQFALHPNPVQNELHISTGIASYGVEIFTLQGQLILSKPDNAYNTTVDYGGFASGIYLMKLTSGSTSQTFKVLKR